MKVYGKFSAELLRTRVHKDSGLWICWRGNITVKVLLLLSVSV